MKYAVGLFLILWLSIKVYGQDTTNIPTSKSSKNSKIESIRNVEAAKQASNFSKEAQQLEILGKDFEKEGNLNQANDYYRKAIQTYLKDKKGNHEKHVSRLYRQIAYNDERMQLNKNAASNYKAAEKFAPTAVDKEINNNDFKRVSSETTIESAALLEKNESLAKQENNAEEVAKISQQKARIAVATEDLSAAKEKVDQVIANNNNQQEVIELQNALAKKYAAAKQLDSAIILTRTNSEAALANQLWPAYFELQLQLAQYYQQQQKKDSMLSVLDAGLKKAYAIGETVHILTMHEAIRNYYLEKGQMDIAYNMTDSLLKGIIHIVKADSSLWNQALFGEIAQKIQVLESEKETQRLLIAKTQTYNWFLLGTLLLVIGGLVYIIRMLMQLRKRNQKIALQSLRREMNPHFIFNSLNSVNQYIALNDPIAANQYLSSYSKLMRNVMASGGKDFVRVKEEYEQLEQYVAIEALRFKEQFDYSMTIDEGLELLFMPNMLIQPFIENAVWHGLRYAAQKGNLSIYFKDKQEAGFTVIVKDDGIGIAASKAAKTKFQKTYESRGLKNIDERIYLINQLYKLNIFYEIQSEPTTGTTVVIHFPKLTDKKVLDEA